MKKYIKIITAIYAFNCSFVIAQIQSPTQQTGEINPNIKPEPTLWCNNPDNHFCPGNCFTNGNFETLTGDPNAAVDMDIFLTTGWNTAFVAIGSNNSSDFSSADIACGGTTLLSSAGGAIPTPDTSVYAGMWIVNNGPTPSDRGENMLNKLVTPIPYNTGNYTFTCDTALGIKGADVINIGVYGVYNPNDMAAINSFTVDPLNYWNNPSVSVVKLGVITPSSNLSAAWETLTFTFDSSVLPPAGITHIMIAGDNVPVASWKRDYLFFDNFCMRSEAEEQNKCCEQDLAIWNVAGTPDPIYTTQQVNPNATIAFEQFEIHQSSTIPITELRVSITDIIYNYNYESCGKCESNHALWGSLLNPFNSSVGGLQFVPGSSGANVQGNLIANNQGVRELVWRNPNGAMLQQGTILPVMYLLPPVSDIPCCVTSVTICTKISWKDANCKACENFTCSHINLETENNEGNNGNGISISKSNDCCGATLTVAAPPNNAIHWSTGETSLSIYVTEASNYSVTVGNQTENIVVLPEDVGTRYYTDLSNPSNHSFYSGSGNVNSYNSFYIMHVEDPQPPYGEYYATEFRLEIWDRWGEQLSNQHLKTVITGKVTDCKGFDNPAIFWDGKINGNRVQQDVYVGKLFLKNCRNKEWTQVKVNWCKEWGYTCLETQCKAGLSFECGFMKKNECTKWSSLMCKEEHKEYIFPITIVW